MHKIRAMWDWEARWDPTPSALSITMKSSCTKFPLSIQLLTFSYHEDLMEKEHWLAQVGQSISTTQPWAISHGLSGDGSPAKEAPNPLCCPPQGFVGVSLEWKGLQWEEWSRNASILFVEAVSQSEAISGNLSMETLLRWAKAHRLFPAPWGHSIAVSPMGWGELSFLPGVNRRRLCKPH